MTLEEAIQDMRNHTDLWPWYWLSYGMNVFATVEAIPATEGDPLPEPGTQLTPDPESEYRWLGENGTKMIVMDTIAEIERQNGGTICRFLAMAHAALIIKAGNPPGSLPVTPETG